MTNGNDSSLSRRSLIQTASGLLAATALAGCASGGTRTQASVAAPTVGGTPKKGTLKIALIGCGGRGTGAAVQALRADPDTVLVAMADVFPDRLESSLAGITESMTEDKQDVAKRIQVPASRQYVGFDGFKKIIDSDVDVVLLTSYPAFRPEHLRMAALAGKHVFSEKPVAVDPVGLQSVLESAAILRQKGLAGMVGFCWRYHDAMREGFKQVLSGGIGDITSVYTNYLTATLSKRPRQAAWSDMEFQMRNWWHHCWLSGDHVVEQSIHSVDRMRWATGDRLPVSVNCLGGRAARNGPEHGDVYDHFSAVYEYANGMKCFHAARQIDGCPADNSDYVYGTEGRATIDGWKPKIELFDRNNKMIWKYEGKPRDMYQCEHNELFASIRAGNPINDMERGAHSTMTAIMARMSAYTGQTVTWDHMLKSVFDIVPKNLALASAPPVVVAVPGQTKLV